MPADDGAADDLTARVRAMLGRQGIMATLGASVLRTAPGETDIALPVSPHISQQDGFVHAGAVAAIADSAAGAAAWTLMPPGSGVLTVEFKINLVAPATGERLLASGRVLKAGRRLTLAATDVHTVTGDTRRLVAHLVATMMTMEPDTKADKAG